MEELIQYVRDHAGLMSLALVFAAAAIEYLIPPLPADTVVVFSAVLILAEAWSFAVVFTCVVLGGVLGSLLQYLLGRSLVDQAGGFRGEAMVHRLFGARSTELFVTKFREHGYWVIALNRFFPGVRAGVFLMSGALNLNWLRVVTFGLVSNLVWSFGLLLLGITVGDNLEKIKSVLSVYRYSAGGIMIALIGVFAYRRWKHRRM